MAPKKENTPPPSSKPTKSGGGKQKEKEPGLRIALRGGSRAPAQPKRNFSSSGHHDDAYETAKWKKITYVGIVGCSIFAIYNLSKGNPHYDEPP